MFTGTQNVAITCSSPDAKSIVWSFLPVIKDTTIEIYKEGAAWDPRFDGKLSASGDSHTLTVKSVDANAAGT